MQTEHEKIVYDSLSEFQKKHFVCLLTTPKGSIYAIFKKKEYYGWYVGRNNRAYNLDHNSLGWGFSETDECKYLRAEARRLEFRKQLQKVLE